MNLEFCEQTIQNTYNKNPSSLENISQLTNNARWNKKLECIQIMWGTTQIRNFLLEQTYQPSIHQWNGIVSIPIQQEINTIQEIPKRKETASTIGAYIFSGLIIFISLIVFLILIKKMLRFFYDIFNSHRIIYLKVLLPRGQSKLDREQDKELAKDMKEKIGRMSLVIHNLHKVGFLSLKEKRLRQMFDKAKITLIYHYENGTLNFIVGSYPEYQKIIEGAISAQFPNCSIEMTKKPKFFAKKYYQMMPIEPKKDPILNIKTYKQQPDDPINNIVDAIGKVSRYDTLSIVIPIKPLGDEYNKKVQLAVDRLYKNLSVHKYSRNRWKYFIMPRKLIGFLIHGPSQWLIRNKKEEENVAMVRMVKAKEDYLNAMGEESALPYFHSWITVVSSSDEKKNLERNMDQILSSLTIYGDEYGNELIEPQTKTDIFWRLFKPIRKIAVDNFITWFGKREFTLW